MAWASSTATRTWTSCWRRPRSSATEAKRADLYKQIQELWLTENPTTPFAQGALFVAYKDTVKGIVLDPLALFHYFLVTKG